jgi:hypothetical protein
VVYEHEYDSPDRARDEIWRRAIADAGIECEQLTVTSETIARACELVSSITSVRRPLSNEGKPSE